MRYLQKSDDRPRNLFSGPLEVKNKVNVFPRPGHKRDLKDDRANFANGRKIGPHIHYGPFACFDALG
jgi:hypothetical protein